MGRKFAVPPRYRLCHSSRSCSAIASPRDHRQAFGGRDGMGRGERPPSALDRFFLLSLDQLCENVALERTLVGPPEQVDKGCQFVIFRVSVRRAGGRAHRTPMP